MEGESGFRREGYGLTEESRRPSVKKGCSPGRAVNACMAFDYLLVFLTALITLGTSAVLTSKLKKGYPDMNVNNETCVLFMSCVGDDTCNQLQYNGSAVCDFIVAGFGIIAFLALVYIGVCIVRFMFSTDIWLWTVIADVVINTCMVVGVMVMGIIFSLGLAVTCGKVNKHYGSSGLGNCSARTIPDSNGYKFYKEANVSQSAAWFCFLFLVISVTIFVIRSCILCRRKGKASAMADSEILTADDDFKDTDDEPPPKAV